MFSKAVRKKSKIKIAVIGPSGSGKTYSSLCLAKGLGGKTAFIDTENGSASLYSDKFDFDVVELAAPYETSKYIEAIKAAEKGGYDNLIIDSLSHAWAGSGGILERKNQYDLNKRGNSYANWKPFSKEQEFFLSEIIHSKINIIATIRSKTQHVLEVVNGRQVPRKVGMGPIQREGIEYEFSVVFELDHKNEALVDNDRTSLFKGGEKFKITENDGNAIKNWLEGGEVVTKLEQARNYCISKVGYIPKEKLEDATKAIKEAKSVEELEKISNYIDQFAKATKEEGSIFT